MGSKGAGTRQSQQCLDGNAILRWIVGNEGLFVTQVPAI